MTDDVGVSSELESYCTACKMMKWHVVVAMVDDKPARVECRGCQKQHAYRPAPPGAPKAPRASKPRTASALRAATIGQDLELKLAGRETDARAYSSQDLYAVDEVIRHSSFGYGLVLSLPAAQRMEVHFRDGRKFLVHDRRGPVEPPRLARPEPSGGDWTVSDAPPKSKLKQ